MTCSTCARFTAHHPRDDSPNALGVCRPRKSRVLPFWAVRWVDDMQTNVRRREGRGCLSQITKTKETRDGNP